jgi:tetratricopeptide (TPR) repeat protein
MIRSKAPFAPIVLVLFMPSLLAAQEPSSWVGQKVVIKYNYPVKVGDRVVDDGVRHVYTVTRTNGDWLWVTWRHIEGWLPASHVVPFDQAIDFYTQEIRSNRGNSAAWSLRGGIWHQKNEFDIAIADFNESIRLNPSSSNAYHGRGWAWYKKKEFDKAIADYNEAIRLDPGSAWTYPNRGLAWKAKKEYDKAIADYNEAIRLDPKHITAYNNRAFLWATCPDPRMRNAQKAIESATRACELTNWKDTLCLDTLAAAYAEAGNFDKAVEWQEKAIKLFDGPDKQEVTDRLNLYRARKPYRQPE